MRLSIISVVVFIAVYVASIVLYGTAGSNARHELAQGEPTADGTTVTIDVEDLQPLKGDLVTEVAVSPGPALLDPLTRGLREDLGIAVTYGATPVKHTWPKGQVPSVFPVTMDVSGDVSQWPFDQYLAGPIHVVLFHGAAEVPEPVKATVIEHVPGWTAKVLAGAKDNPLGQYSVQLHRTRSVALFTCILVVVLIALAGLALVVAVQTKRGRRKFQPPMTTWYAAMLFAVVPLRNAFPNAPPFGAWIDVVVTVWVIVVMVISMVLYIFCWWEHLRPDAPAKPAESASSR
ncbi:DUF4436 domain-containing protein [Mycobacterium sp.]|uniref:DUF4436 domain-containing protein n=1 Tax=Mycobacterium sp. TaxID=1785 RepID=UPI0025DC0945|nr:DUF4436 domain-containing protein [Mycobacterium sp.]MBW0015343.1 DUF4436 domain-containing protein [Mycobacterium sp.]